MTKQPTLTIGMAHYEDFHGLYFTVQALRLYHRQHLADAELIIIDNSPDTEHSKMVQGVVASAKTSFANVQYIPMADNAGTSVSRQAIFDNATGKYVVCMDCHVLLVPGALDALMVQYAADPETQNIYSGPLVYDNLQNKATHFDDVWSAEMWGVWGQSWKCGCGQAGAMFSITEDDTDPSQRKTAPRHLGMGNIPIAECDVCGTKIPHNVPWHGHEKAYLELGHKPYGLDPTDEPFEIPGMGLGLFSMRKAAWPGFNPHARGFGGEELYIHGKIRAQGGKAICLPAFQWLHRFGRPDGVKYPLTRWNKVRNYVLEFQELGWDLQPIYEHFVASGLMTAKAWQALVDNAIGQVNEPPGCNTCGQRNQAGPDPAIQALTSPAKVFSAVVQQPRDLDQHMPHLRALASKCPRITEFTQRRESTIAFAAGGPKSLVSYQMESEGMLARLKEVMPNTTEYKTYHRTSDQVPEILETDLLFLDSEHTYAILASELQKYAPQVTRYIVMHDTQLYSDTCPDGGPGLLHAITDFMKNNPEWSVISHTKAQHGLTVIGRRKDDKPKLPGKLTMAKNFTKALVEHVATGADKAALPVYEARLQACSLCTQRNDEQCSVCGCTLTAKASWAESTCPLGAWPMQEGDVVAAPPHIITDQIEHDKMPRLEMNMEPDGKGGVTGTGRLVMDNKPNTGKGGAK